nr:carbonyl reductase [NADPH] 1-like isoform X2 [Rhipicephalus microplus]
MSSLQPGTRSVAKKPWQNLTSICCVPSFTSSTSTTSKASADFATSSRQNSTAPVAEQAKVTVNTNFFGTLNVCKELFPLLRPHARVVNVSSMCGMLQRIPGEELKKKLSNPDITVDQLCDLMNDYVQAAKDGTNVEKGWGQSSYNVSKVGVTVLTFIQQRDFNADPREDLVVNAVHPGYVNTDMSSHKGPLTPEQGADAATYLALLPPNIESPKGEFVWHDRAITPWDK